MSPYNTADAEAPDDSEAKLVASVRLLDIGELLTQWRESCAKDHMLAAGAPVEVDSRMLIAVLTALELSQSIDDEEDPDLVRAALDFVDGSRAATLAVRQLIVLGVVLLDAYAADDSLGLREFSRRTQLIVGRCCLYCVSRVLR